MVAGFPAGVAAWAGGAEDWAGWADKMSLVPKTRMLAATPATSITLATRIRFWSNIVRFLVPYRPNIQIWMSGLHEVV